jgi:hypothetical protein
MTYQLSHKRAIHQIFSIAIIPLLFINSLIYQAEEKPLRATPLLELGKPVEEPLKAGASDFYQINLTAGSGIARGPVIDDETEEISVPLLLGGFYSAR